VVYQISTTQFDNKFRCVDLHNIRVGNPPKLAHLMPLQKLHALVRELGVPRVTPEMGAQDVLLRIGVWQLEELDKAEAADERDALARRD
jgi:hypothetical protein